MILAGLLAFLIIGGSGGYFLFAHVFRQTEESLYKESVDEYDHGQYGLAASHFRQLQEKFPSSERKDEYSFLARLSDLRNTLSATQRKPEDNLAALESFLDAEKTDPQFQAHGRDLSAAAAPVLTAFVANIPSNDTTPQQLERIEKFRDALNAELEEKGLTTEEAATLTAALADSRSRHALWLDKQAVLVRLRNLPGAGPGPIALEQAHQLLRFGISRRTPMPPPNWNASMRAT